MRTEGDWPARGRRAGLVVASMGLNAGLIALLSITDTRPGRPGPSAAAPLYLYIEPRPRLAQERAPVRAVAASHTGVQGVVEDADGVPRPDSRPDSSMKPSPPAPTPAPRGAIDSRWRIGPVAPTRGLPLSCEEPNRLSVEMRRYCDDRARRFAGTARPIAGSGDAERDAVFARHGARRLAAWEDRRAEPKRGDPPCETPHPVAGCEGVNIEVELFSSRDGLLPNLRKRRE
ncbi:hypothetical protein [Brevundimonas mediterranea]|uniref:Uncharacterized protein n=1 Tax=Brevundimonas mediterranea TaxID=74329 RepID=A0A7W6EYH4_9CAUL|nr:hypothetical protein [Brevundimonas mediterranea]MBB3870789.1 hypothetical protein [Brevundimonas mediterranea]